MFSIDFLKILLKLQKYIFHLEHVPLNGSERVGKL